VDGLLFLSFFYQFRLTVPLACEGNSPPAAATKNPVNTVSLSATSSTTGRGAGLAAFALKKHSRLRGWKRQGVMD
jgi:hypothetical protein